MGKRTVRSATCIAAMFTLARIVYAQPDPCAGRGSKPDGSCRAVAPRREPPTGPTGVEITSGPSGAEVRNDHGVVLGLTPLRLDASGLAPGTHHVSIRLYGYEDALQTITVMPHRVQRAHIVLVPMPQLNLEPANDDANGATVYIDTRRIGSIPLHEYPVPSGPHVLQVEKKDFVSWQEGIDLPAGSKPRTVKVALERAAGTLVVGDVDEPSGDRYPTWRPMRGATVYLDPTSTEEPSTGIYLGQEPLTVPVPAGPHLVVIALEYLPTISTLVTVVPGRPSYVSAMLPMLKDLEVRDAIDIDLAKAQHTCDSSRDAELTGDACLVLGNLAMHPTGGGRANVVEAERRYRKGCDAGSPMACFALGYVQRQRASGQKRPADADPYFRKACRASLPVVHACWARYAARMEDVPDPTLYGEAGARFARSRPARPERNDALIVSSTFGVGASSAYPIYAELDATGRFSIANPQLFVDLRLGPRFRRYRLLEPGGQASTRYELGLGADLGLTLRPVEESRTVVSLGIRGNIYNPLQVSYGPTLAVGYETDSGLLQLGLFLDRLPLRVEEMTDLGVQLRETQRWSAILTLSYGLVTTP